jgi:hypothetical protein
METAIERLAVLCLTIIGLSHIAQPRGWAEFFIYLRSKGVVGVFATAFIHLPLGALVVSFHNTWTGIPALLTVLGWCWVIKSTLYFVLPKVGLWSLARVNVEKSHHFVFAGVVLLVLAAIIAVPLFAYRLPT